MMLVKLNSVATFIIVLSIVMAAPSPSASTSPIAKPGCQSRCGHLHIPYPFGIGSPDCFYNKWFEILCKNHRLYLQLYQDGVEAYEVLQLRNQGQGVGGLLVIRSNTSYMRACEDTSIFLGPNLTGTPFHYLSDNKFMLVGTGTVTIFSPPGFEEEIGGCTSVSYRRRLWTSINPCQGVGCCEDNFVNYDGLTELKVNYSNALTGNNSCASVFVVGDSTWYPKNISLFSDPSVDLAVTSVSFWLDWTFPKAMPGHGFANNKYCRDASNDTYWSCQCPCGFYGNQYIVDGCQDGSDDCSKPFILRNLKSIVVGGVFLLIFALATACYLLYKTIRRRINKKMKEKMFKRNGGALLQKHLSSSENIMEKVRLFTAKVLNEATDQFNENRVLGRGGQGTVYKGMLADGKIVAIKKSKLLVNANQVEEFINEIIILSQIDHRNVVKLFGCCLEMDVPLLVYEYIPNGTLYNLIHHDSTHFPLTWEVRLRISLEVAEALAYLHSATSIPVYHRDIKSSNILLDEKYIAKVADFGTSRNIRVDQTHLTTLVKGTFGYLDPEYFQSSQFTEKSDVYSFGVVLVELLTGLKPICFSEEEQSHLNLATRFLLALEENCVHIILDPQVKKTSTEEEREAIIRLSQRCLNMNGRNRPSMKEIVVELQCIKMSKIPSTVLENSYEKEEIVNLSGVGKSFHITTSLSDDSPFLSSSF